MSSRDAAVSTAPADVVRALLNGVSRLNAGGLRGAELEAQLDRLAALYGERTDVRHPFAPFGGEPRRSRAQLREHFAAGAAADAAAGMTTETCEPAGVRMHETADPEVVIVEFCYRGTVDGRRFDLPAIFVVRVRDGLIVESRDYADHVAAARAFGELGALASRLADEAAAP